MPAEIVPFPWRRRGAQIRKTVHYMLTLDRKHAEAHLQSQLRRLRGSLERKGVPIDRIDEEVSSYEGALRAATWRALLSEGGAA